MNIIDAFLDEVRYFFHPIVSSAKSVENLKRFFILFGHDVSPDVLFAQLSNLDPSFDETMEALEASIQAGGALEVADEAFEAIGQFAEAVADELGADLNELLPEIFDYLVVHYLNTRIAPASAILEGLGVIDKTELEPAESGRDAKYERVELRWSRLGHFLNDTEGWGEDVYGWGTDFDHQLALSRMVKVIESTMLAVAHVLPMTTSETTGSNAFLKNPTAAGANKVNLPIIQDDLADVSAEGRPSFKNEAGISILPFGDQNSPDELGFAIAPYADGGDSQELELSEQFKLTAEMGITTAGGSFVSIQPDSVDANIGGGVDASFELGFQFRNKDNLPIVLGELSNGSQVAVDAFLGSVGGNLSGDAFVAGGVENLRARIDVSDDGFLGAIVPEPIEVEVGSVIMGWRAGRGVYFDGGTNVMITVPLDVELGPIQLHEAVLIVDWSNDVSVSLLLTADAQLGPLFAYVERTGLVVRVSESPDNTGLLGQYDLDFSFQAPSGYAIELDAAPIKGGGFISINGSEYRGALALKFQQWGFSAFGILNTELPNNRPGFSFAASIFGEFSLPLGYGFFLTGLGGVIGINRTVDTQALRDVLYEGRLDNILFPADPIANAATILDDMGAILPAREGQHVFGPVARIGWGQPVLIEVRLGVVLEVGDEIRVLLLGGVGIKLPTKEAALVDINSSFFGVIDFAAETIEFDASLVGSRILSFVITGDCAIRTGWAPRLQHVASFGGLHPQYPKPSNLPDLSRLSISFGSNNPRITLSAYQAITTNSFQFGSRADLYAKGPKIWLVGRLAAEGEIFFDALIYFNPFQFDVMLGGGLRLLVDGDVQAGLGFSLRLRGPNQFIINGKVWITVFGIDVDFRIDHTWGTPQNLPIETVSAIELLRNAIEQTGVLEVVQPNSRTAGVSFLTHSDVENLIDPLGGVRFIQSAMPLDVTIEKIGEAQVVGQRRLDLVVTGKDNALLDVQPETADFVRAHFFETSDDEKLRVAAFETYKAGFELSSDSLFGPTDKAIEEVYSYEYIEIGVEENKRARLDYGLVTSKTVNQDFSDRWLRHSNDLVTRSNPELVRPSRPVSIRQDVFLPEQQIGNINAELEELLAEGVGDVMSADRFIDDGFTQPSFQLTREELGLNRRRVSVLDAEANPVVASYVAAAGL